MKFPELDEWAAQAGLSKEELALIQPGYYFTFDGPLLAVTMAAWAAGLVTFVINAVQLARRRYGTMMITVGYVATAILLFLTMISWCGWRITYGLATHRDTASLHDIVLPEVGKFVQGTMISLGIAFLTGGIAFYRRRTSMYGEYDNYQYIVGNQDSPSQEGAESQTEKKLQ